MEVTIKEEWGNMNTEESVEYSTVNIPVDEFINVKQEIIDAEDPLLTTGNCTLDWLSETVVVSFVMFSVVIVREKGKFTLVINVLMLQQLQEETQ